MDKFLGLLDRGPSRCDPKRGQREVAGDFSVADSKGMVPEAACGCIENTEEFHVRLDKGIVESGDSLRGYPAGRAFLENEFIFRATVIALDIAFSSACGARMAECYNVSNNSPRGEL